METQTWRRAGAAMCAAAAALSVATAAPGETGERTTKASAADRAWARVHITKKLPTFAKTDTPVKAVVLAADATGFDKTAAEVIRTYAQRMTGRELPLVASPAEPVSKGLIYVGDAAARAGIIGRDELEAVEDQGFVIRTAGANVGLAGGWRKGTLYGAYRLLETMGVEFYSRSFEIVPDLETLAIPKVAIATKPHFIFRSIVGTEKLGMHTKGWPGRHGPAEDVANLQQIFPELDKHYGWMSRWHTAAYLVPYVVHGKEHPEYYAKDARGHSAAARGVVDAHKLHLCMTNEDVRRIYLQNLLTWIERSPKHVRFFSIAPADGYSFCQCPRCKARCAAPGNYTDLVMEFSNYMAREVAKKHPDKILMTLAYGSTTEPAPTKVRPAPNVMVFLCPYLSGPCRYHTLTCEKNRRYYETSYTPWTEAVDPAQLAVYDYPGAGGMGFTHWAFTQRVKMYARDGLRGLYLLSNPNFMEGLFVYLMGRLTWDPSLDALQLQHNYLVSYYSPAADDVNQLVELLKANTWGNPTNHSRDLSKKLAPAALAIVEAAERACGGKQPYLGRVQDIKAFVLYENVRFYNPVKGMDQSELAFKRKLAELLALAKDGKGPRYFGKKGLIAREMQRLAGLQVTAEDWTKDALVLRLIAAPAQVKIPEGIRQNIVHLKNGALWDIPLYLFDGARDEKRDGRNVLAVYGHLSEFPAARAEFVLKKAPAAAAKLHLTGGDDPDRPGTHIAVLVNDTEIFRGRNGFSAKGLSRRTLTIPAGVLKADENVLRIENREEGSSLKVERFFLAEAWLELAASDRVPVPAPKGTTLLVHFDEPIEPAGPDADGAAARHHMKACRVAPKLGKWGGALDAGYRGTEGSTKQTGLKYLGGNYDPVRGTAEVWVKPRWDLDADDSAERRTLLHFDHWGAFKRAGFWLRKEAGGKLVLTFYDQGQQTHFTAAPKDWDADEWHHLAVTWDRADRTVQLFVDGVCAVRSEDTPVGGTRHGWVVIGAHCSGRMKAGALFDEFRVSDVVRWQGTPGARAFDVPNKPYDRRSDPPASRAP